TLVGSLTEIRPLRTEEPLSARGTRVDRLDGGERKSTTTVALDFRRITIRENLVIYLSGTPGQQHFWFMWDELSRGTLGAIVMADTRRLADCFPSVDYFEQRHIPFVVGVNCFDGARRYRGEAVRAALDLDPGIPVVMCDARQRPSCRGTVIALPGPAGAPGRARPADDPHPGPVRGRGPRPPASPLRCVHWTRLSSRQVRQIRTSAQSSDPAPPALTPRTSSAAASCRPVATGRLASPSSRSVPASMSRPGSSTRPSVYIMS